MITTVRNNAINRPSAVAVIDGDNRVTYHALWKQSSLLAHSLEQFGLSWEEPVGILFGPGLKTIMAQLAVLQVGGTCVPLDPQLIPERRLESMLEDVGVKTVIAEHVLPESFQVYRQVSADVSANLEGIAPLDFSEPLSHNHRTHILFTSGTTGQPKPVQIESHSIMHLATKAPVTPLEHTDKVAAFNNPGFDLSLFEIWVTLLGGATAVVVPHDVATDPGSLGPFLKAAGVTVLTTTAAVFEIIALSAPGTYSDLRHVLTGGNVANSKALLAVLADRPPGFVWNTYGPTECTNMSTMHLVTENEVHRRAVSIGRPIGDVELYLLGEDQKVILDAEVTGEIYIGGPGLSRGYLNRPRENPARFLTLPKSVLTGESTHDSSNIRLYRTGDIAQWRQGSGCLEFKGRLDNQVKLNGFRVELEEIESILRSHECIIAAIAVFQRQDTQYSMTSITAFLKAAEGRKVDLEELMQFCHLRMPMYMSPRDLVVVNEFPINSRGKVDRDALMANYMQGLCQKQSHDGYSKHRLGVSPNGISEALTIVQGIWTEILGVSEVTNDDDFLRHGVTSIQTAAMIALLKDRLGQSITMRELYQHRTPEALARRVSTRLRHIEALDQTNEWLMQAESVDRLQSNHPGPVKSAGRIFLTGATGFVGAHLLRALLDREAVIKVVCLVRPNGTKSPAQRLQANLERYDLWPGALDFRNKVEVVEGDLSLERLGLPEAKYSWLTNWTDTIFHLGAKVNFCDTYEQHFEPNVMGTSNMLRFAVTGRRKTFHYFSSIDVWGGTGFILGTTAVDEDECLKKHIHALRYDTGYAQTQWVCEQMVRNMRESGLPTIIYRAGFVIGNSGTGVSNPDDLFGRFIVSCIKMKTFPYLDIRMEWVTIDYMIEAVLHIASSDKNLGRSYHILSPDPMSSANMEKTCAIINEAGYRVRMVGYAEWVEQVDAWRRTEGSNPVAPLLPAMLEPVLGPYTRWEIGQYSPHYRASNTIEALRDRPDVVYKPLDAAILQKHIDWWNRKGFYDI
ncbi:putative NRPS-like enzyme [Aspergillus indologenus CBS 114.80]|uniref:Putative NRPS-like enzyme n=1 Tax=Aspergillus indologenus CBS 114.80 TaxID=1450541 RepID=A0A2V5I1M6_9EURO|nr:putative NRPS-like enzyme [Aspergillus indologenus CBS 114.80]